MGISRVNNWCKGPEAQEYSVQEHEWFSMAAEW